MTFAEDIAAETRTPRVFDFTTGFESISPEEFAEIVRKEEERIRAVRVENLRKARQAKAAKRAELTAASLAKGPVPIG